MIFSISCYFLFRTWFLETSDYGLISLQEIEEKVFLNTNNSTISKTYDNKGMIRQPIAKWFLQENAKSFHIIRKLTTASEEAFSNPLISLLKSDRKWSEKTMAIFFKFCAFLRRNSISSNSSFCWLITSIVTNIKCFKKGVSSNSLPHICLQLTCGAILNIRSDQNEKVCRILTKNWWHRKKS